MIRLIYSLSSGNELKYNILTYLTVKHFCALLLLLLFLPITTKGQSPDVQARILYTEAEEYYSSNNFSAAISNLDQVVKILSKTNPKVEVLYSKSFFQSKKFEEAENHLKTYFSLADESNNNFDEMIQLKVNIKKASEQLALEKRKKEEQAERERKEREYINQQKLKDSQAFSDAVSYKKIGYYRKYVEQFPNGEYVDKANHMISLWDKQKGYYDIIAWNKKQIRMTLWLTGLGAVGLAYGIPKLKKAGGVVTDLSDGDAFAFLSGCAFTGIGGIVLLPTFSTRAIRAKSEWKAFKRNHRSALPFLIFP